MTRSPTAASTGSAATIAPAATTSMTTTPRDIGSGAKTCHVASTSALAFESSWPAGCRWCQASGRRRYCRVTARRYRAWSRYIVIPAAARRVTTPTAVTTATSARAPAASATWVPVTRPAAKAGARTASVTRPST